MNYIVGVDLLDGMKSLEKHSKQVCFFSIDQIPPFDWFIVIENTLKQYNTNTEGHFVLRIEEPSLMRAEDAHLGCRASHTGNHQVCDELHWYDVWIDMSLSLISHWTCAKKWWNRCNPSASSVPHMWLTFFYNLLQQDASVQHTLNRFKGSRTWFYKVYYRQSEWGSSECVCSRRARLWPSNV